VPALHGGVICALLEITALGQLGLEDTFPRPPKPVNVSVQYLRTGRPVETFARASVNRIGRTIASVEAVAWQDDPNHAIATLQAHFLLTPAEGEIADQK
ncbi:MAG: PaaI family thioesterase, partial [Asticcacaulis sp.]